MRLIKIKLAGFKSFVDPTTFHIPSNLVAIVGPNGCGKSNVIDAVRWVMGESSARYLRGESMADVIFNGSSARKPVGQASIELVFDNSQGKLGGPWAEYAQIAIKRLVTRSGQSNYFLNGTRCRRRDITDIFLGTGLGPRSYAIIEQGMISRIIEARPEELRLFLEEAAGISKYKERRRETETRMRHTQENLERLNDVREELAKQLQNLQRQAKAAEQYRTLKAEERQLKAELLGLRWRILEEERIDRETAIRDRETTLEAVVADQRQVEARLESGRERQTTLNEAYHRIQERYYLVGSDITRLEQQMAHRRELRQHQNDELHQTAHTLEQIMEQMCQDRKKRDELERTLAESEPALETVRSTEIQSEEDLALTEANMQKGQTAWEAFQQRTGEFQRASEIQRTRIEHLERQLLQQSRRLDRLRLEREALDETTLEGELSQARQAEQEAAEDLALAQEELDRTNADIAELHGMQQRLTEEFNEIQTRIQTSRGRLASLETLQEEALGKRETKMLQWLRQQDLERAPRLAERLHVEPGWEQAVEMVLGSYLEAVCVEDLDALAATLPLSEKGQLTLFDTGFFGRETAKTSFQTLLDKVTAPWPLEGLLANVRLCDDVTGALALRPELGEQESLVTPTGVWMGRNWLRLFRSGDEAAGVLLRERETQSLQERLAQDQTLWQQKHDDMARIQGQLPHLEDSRDAIHEEIHQGHRRHARLQEQVNTLRTRFEHSRARREAVREEYAELEQQTERDQEDLQEARMYLEEALFQLEQLDGEHETLTRQRESARQELEVCRRRAAEVRQDFRRQALTVESLRTKLGSLRQTEERLAVQHEQLQSRHAQLTEQLIEEDEPDVRERLETLLTNRVAIEEELATARQTVEEQDATLKTWELERTDRSRRIQELSQVLESQRLAYNEIRVRQQTLADQLAELSTDLTALLKVLPNTAEETAWLEKLQRLEKRIQRLGPINLAAIDEFAQLSERKQYLDAQNDDLVEALTTLENAIRKIDRETRSRLKHTFEQVNEGMGRLFPRLFGGGQAYLELTGEDVLDAGVAIMARPPGKRIGNIHLLSGGEKALTAIALVFAIFNLTPAPFCMLDEVDAPLDETNVGRFGELVREMSEQIQFIFITHNKGTMEIARHLSGVTMHEPGVSRLVAVDVDEAVRLAAV